MMRVAICLAIFLFGLAAPVRADGAIEKIITSQDRSRLQRYEPIKKAALAEAEAGGATEDLAVLRKALEGRPLSMSGNYKITGNWRCQMIKVGSKSTDMLALVVYPAFKCRVKDTGAGWFMEKISGSQRISGYLYTDGDKRLIYLGAGSVNDDPPRKYNQQMEFNEPAYVSRLANNKLVFEFPEPTLESKLNVLVLQR